MPRPIRTVTALLLLPTLATAQDARPAPQGWSAYFAMGSSSIPGTTPLGAAAPAGSMGVAYERPVSGRLTWRAELGYGAAAGTGGPAASVFADESTVQLLRTHLGASVRRYTGRNAWVAGGMAIAFRNDCYVDVAGGVGVTGTSSIDCADFADRTYEVPAVAAHPQLQARGRWTEILTEGGAWPALLPPHNLAGVAPHMGRVPALGEHTAEVLAELAGEG